MHLYPFTPVHLYPYTPSGWSPLAKGYVQGVRGKGVKDYRNEVEVIEHILITVRLPSILDSAVLYQRWQEIKDKTRSKYIN